MFLTKEEESILAGSQGSGMQSAMQLIVDVGTFFEAEKLIPITSAHISGVSYLTGKDGLIKNLSHFVDIGATVAPGVVATLNPCGMDRDLWSEMSVKPSFADKQKIIIDSYQKLGVSTTCTCTPYDAGHVPMKGQSIAWAESSAICFANTYFGARSNKEDALSVLAAALTGKTPYYGFHITENRIPNVNVKVNAKLEDLADYGALGQIVGGQTKKLGFPLGVIPVFTMDSYPKAHHIKSLGAALASYNCALYHIKNVTPEQELLTNMDKIDIKITVTQEEIDQIYKDFGPPVDSSRPDAPITVIGCPNASLEEILEVTTRVKDKKLKSGKEFWIFTNRAQKSVAESCGYLDTLSKAGVKVFCDTCPEVFPYDKKKFPAVLTNSTKAIHYIPAPSLNNTPAYFLKLDDCVERSFD
jgi:predicted aconitase